MKALVFLLLLTVAARPAATTYRLDPAASTLTWTGHAEVGSYAPTGTVRLREGSLAAAGTVLQAARVVVDISSIAHEQAQLAEHLRGADFFDAARFPTAVFELRRFGRGQAQGTVTIKGIAQPLTVPVQVGTIAGGGLRLRGTLTLDRTAFGIRHNSASFFKDLGDQAIRNDFQLTFDLVGK